MDPLWSLEVEGFGRIAHARIEQAPLLVLVGKNNSGKSYMASLLWGLMNFNTSPFKRFGRRFKEGPPILMRWVDEFFASDRKNDEFVVDSVLVRQYGELIEDFIKQTDFVKFVFSSSQVEVGRLSFHACGANGARLRIAKSPERRLSIGRGHANGRTEIDFVFGRVDDDKDFLRSMARGDVNSYLINDVLGLSGMPGSSQTVYIPAARTGLLLAKSALLAEFAESWAVVESRSATELTFPMIDFFQCIQKPTSREEKLSVIADALEMRVLNGGVEVDGASGEWRFRHAEGEALPLHVTSSMVTELAPFIVLLRSRMSINGFIIEEPEAHLHLSAQREMARALVKIVNMGIPVVITTHSDTFVQQINLLMHLHGHKRRDELMAKFGYEANETLDPEKARAYEFVDDGSGRTVARELTKEEEGFVVPSLNETLADLAKELYEFDKP